MVEVPLSYWKSRERARSFLGWLTRELGLLNDDEWYRVSPQEFYTRGAGGLLIHYNNSIRQLLQTILSSSISTTSNNNNNNNNHDNNTYTSNQSLYMWLPWKFHHLQLKDNSVDMNRQLENIFDNLPNQFWDDLSHQRQFVDWIGRYCQDLSILKEDDWYSVSSSDLIHRGGRELLLNYYSGSLVHMLEVRTSFPYIFSRYFEHLCNRLVGL